MEQTNKQTVYSKIILFSK